MPLSLETAFQLALDQKPTLANREALVRSLSRQVKEKTDMLIGKPDEADLFIKLGKPDEADLFIKLGKMLKETSFPFPLPSTADIPSLDADIRAGKVTLRARANGPTPIFHTSNIRHIFGGSTGNELVFNEFNQINSLETVALLGTAFDIVGASLDGEDIIYQVTTPEYPYASDNGYFVNARFLDVLWMPLMELPGREKCLPSQEDILANLRDAIGLPYIWGGNVPTGVPKLLEYYPPTGLVEEKFRAKWTLRGVDCSGLLHTVTKGFTPRNTSSLVSYGTSLPIAGKNAQEIIALLEPLDIIALKGHMLLVLNKQQVIQSKADYGTESSGFQNGVKILPLREVLERLLVSKTPVNSIKDDTTEWGKGIMIRRWYDEQSSK